MLVIINVYLNKFHLFDLDSFRMGKIIGEAFSATLLAHLLGATSLVCILGYQILTVSQNHNEDRNITFNTFTYLKSALNTRF